MSLFNRKNFLDNYSFFFFIDIISAPCNFGKCEDGR